MSYNGFDHAWHGTADERRAFADVTKEGTRFYDLTNAVMYRSDGKTWRLEGEPSLI